MNNNNTYILKMKNITKTFPGVKALENVNLNLKKGTVHALLGENGAGKSTLMKVLMGIHEPNKGEVEFNGEKLEFSNINNALEKGISMIHQELTPIPHMTVAENIFLNREPRIKNTFFVDEKKLIEQTKQLFEKINISIDPETEMKDLTIANMQMVEIAKAISYDAKLIIMDEPTSSITDKEVKHLFELINDLRKNEVSIIYITHKMDEVFKIADEVTILRDGKYIGSDSVDNLTTDKIITMMVGRELKDVFSKEESEITDVILSAKNLSYKSTDPLKTDIKNVSFEIKKGEVLGISGLIGAGRSELMDLIFGINRPDEGEIFINNEKVVINSPKDAISHGLALVPEDRHKTGLFLPLNIKDNLIIGNLKQFANNNILINNKIKKYSQAQRERLNIKTPSLKQLIKNLSGGNQQKVVIGRWLMTNPDILILDEPTRGIDIGAKQEIHKIISELAKEGKAIIMISSEMPEILGASDRIMVMHEGKKMGEFDREEATQENIMHLATGNKKIEVQK